MRITIELEGNDLEKAPDIMGILRDAGLLGETPAVDVSKLALDFISRTGARASQRALVEALVAKSRTTREELFEAVGVEKTSQLAGTLASASRNWNSTLGKILGPMLDERGEQYRFNRRGQEIIRGLAANG